LWAWRRFLLPDDLLGSASLGNTESSDFNRIFERYDINRMPFPGPGSCYDSGLSTRFVASGAGKALTPERNHLRRIKSVR